MVHTHDEETSEWLRDLDLASPCRTEALERLHRLLLRAAFAEVTRRRDRHSLSGPEQEDLAHQAAHDAMMAILAKVDEFRGESRFTTWAYKFVILEVSNKIGRHFWQRPSSILNDAQWDRLPDRLGIAPDDQAIRTEILETIRRAVTNELTEHQQRVFLALVVEGIPLDALAARLDCTRNSLYKTMFDARRKLRAALVADGHIETDQLSAAEESNP
jgi:RNA polymerase sigma-70 factor (ECF subfamily)